jgi:hypothetical protein
MALVETSRKPSGLGTFKGPIWKRASEIFFAEKLLHRASFISSVIFVFINSISSNGSTLESAE